MNSNIFYLHLTAFLGVTLKFWILIHLPSNDFVAYSKILLNNFPDSKQTHHFSSNSGSSILDGARKVFWPACVFFKEITQYDANSRFKFHSGWVDQISIFWLWHLLVI